MILLLGSSGFIGSEFAAEMRRRGMDFHAATRAHDRYDVPGALSLLLDQLKPSLVINSAAFIPTRTVDDCKYDPFHAIMGNVALPAMLAQECKVREIPLCHLSTACLFNESKAFTETDIPTRGWDGYCGFYVGSKFASEKIVALHPKHYILRLRLPFDEFDNPRCYLSKLASFPRVFDHVNSLSHRGDFVKAALDLLDLNAPYGIYHVANPGWISAAYTIEMMCAAGMADATGKLLVDDPHTTGCTLSVKKLLDAGVKIREVHEAIDDSLANWKASK